MVMAIIVLASVFIATGTESLEESKKSAITNEIHQIKEAIVNKYVSYQKNDGNVYLNGVLAKSKWPNSGDCIDLIVDLITYQEGATFEEKAMKISKISAEIGRDYDKYVKIIHSGDMASLGLENYATDSVYIVNYKTGGVYGPISE